MTEYERRIVMQVNILEAKTKLSSLIRMIETGEEEIVVISKYGKPVVKMVGCQDKPASKRIGIAKGKLKTPQNFDADNGKIADMFGGSV